jgi:hypothetical protein
MDDLEVLIKLCITSVRIEYFKFLLGDQQQVVQRKCS